MRIGTNNLRGELPHLAPEALPDQGAQEATNCLMETGNLQPFKQFAQTKVLANTGTVQTIFLAQHPTTDASAWLSFNAQVDIARNVVEDDPDGLLLLTCPDLYDTPVYTTYAAATTGAEPYPVSGSTLPLGVPGPSDIPVLALGVDPTPTTFSIDVLDEGAELDTQWTHSPIGGGDGLYAEVKQETSGGNPGSCYSLWYDESKPGQGPWAYRKVDTAPATLIIVTADFKFTNSDDDATRRAGLAVAVNEEGIGCAAQVYNGNTLRIVNQVDKTGWFGVGVIDTVACALSHNVWYTFNVTMEVKENGTQTVTAKVLNGATEIASLTATAVFTVGDYVGINAISGSDAGFRFTTLFDNIHVQASGATGITPNLTATNYLYTFVNNRGWESVPSLPTEDILRPDGVSVTVTTSTTAPTGYSAVTHKRIYRLVSALTGDLFLLVAEIPLAQADYVDTLTDNQVGPDVLESQEFDLPPATLQDIIALPCGAYAGFFGKQLCISAAGWPHAWPVRQRHACEFPIVGIDKLGNTIVVGTTGRVYTCTGTEPSNYVMSEPGESQACLSKRGMVFLDGQGVAFPSPDGYQLCAGSAGNLRNLTENVFTRLQWQEKNPSSIIAAVHDGVLHWYWETTETPTETLLFLFHMTNSESSEGIAEFTGPYDAVDQTGAAWEPDVPSWQLLSSFPYPKFGQYLLAPTAQLTWARLAPQSNPSIPDDFSTASAETMHVDTWVYIQASAVPVNASIQISVGNITYPLISAFDLVVNDDYNGFVRFDNGDVFLITVETPIPTDQWAHLRMVYTGAALALFVNGVLAVQVAGSGLLALVNPINLMTISLPSAGMYLDDSRAILGGTNSLDNFTPPTAPWPNP